MYFQALVKLTTAEGIEIRSLSVRVRHLTVGWAIRKCGDFVLLSRDILVLCRGLHVRLRH